MNRALAAVLLSAVFVSAPLVAGAAGEHPSLKNLPPAFTHLKSLAGSWQCVGTGMEATTTSFEVVANGSAIMERLVPGHEDTMINVYHPDGDAVVMTHYCASGNQPRLRCGKDGSSLTFAMADISNWKKGEPRMSQLTIEMVDADHMKQTWTSDMEGKSEILTMEFVRKK